ncbi:pitrilysin family protein [Bacteroides sp. 519]|uniref:M16 family metallopeptidase n=1 Tax=Bacteroides sp. 519 TaxID=2302937 RepID=UPI0013D7CC22|nr:pitrilysin family protein [Bacteroides sp. 519]
MPERKTQPSIQPLDKINIQHPEKIVMPNGIPVYVINSGEQDVIRMDIVFKGGSWQQAYKLQALFTNRMLREGTEKYSAGEIAEKLDYYGAWLELSSSLEYAYITLYSLIKYLPQTLEILESIVKEPVFPEKELSTLLKANLQQFLINSTRVDFIAHRNLLSSLFGDQNPCARLVNEKDYEKVNREMLCEFYRSSYHYKNCSIYLSGKVTESTKSLIENSFGKDKFGNGNNQISTIDYPISTIKSKRIFTECKDALQSAVKLGEFSIPRQHPDYLKLRVLITLFGGYFGSRLMSNIREDKGYTYGISAGLFFYPGTGLLTISTETANEYVDSLINEVYREIDVLQTTRVSEKELSIVKNYMIGEMSRSYESSLGLADAWIFIHTSGLDNCFFDDSLKAVKETTPTDLLDLACKYLDKENLKEVIAGKNLS